MRVKNTSYKFGEIFVLSPCFLAPLKTEGTVRNTHRWAMLGSNWYSLLCSVKPVTSNNFFFNFSKF